MAAPPAVEKHKPQFAKLVVGPAMTLCEMVAGGHYMEMLKIVKQAQRKPYVTAAKEMWQAEGWLSLYKGFVPWGLLQTVKGVPVLFIQSESTFRLQRAGFGRKESDTMAGVLGGAGQGVFMTPTQRLKTIVMTDPRFAGAQAPQTVGAAFRAATSVATISVREDGIGTLFKGLGPMVLKRGFDWGLRFLGVAWTKVSLEQYNARHGGDKTLSLTQNLACGFIGGAASTMTMPLDSLVSNTQKAAKAAAGERINAYTVAKKMWAEGRYEPFLRGWTMRVIHAGYHTMWMTTVGTYAYDAYAKIAHDKK